jgi:hypothetical protein
MSVEACCDSVTHAKVPVFAVTVAHQNPFMATQTLVATSQPTVLLNNRY